MWTFLDALVFTTGFAACWFAKDRITLLFAGTDRRVHQVTRGQGGGVEGDSVMLAKIKAFCLHSLTIAWGYALAIVGGAMSVIDNIGDALGDPGLKDQINAAIGDARIAGRVLLGISIITILARLRSLRKAG